MGKLKLLFHLAARYKLVLAVVGVLAGGLGGYIWSLKSTIDSQADKIADLNQTLGNCESSNTRLRSSIESQNRAVEQAEQLTAELRERQRNAQEEAQEAINSADKRIAQIRDEKEAETATCEQVRKSLISEATGYVF